MEKPTKHQLPAYYDLDEVIDYYTNDWKISDEVRDWFMCNFCDVKNLLFKFDVKDWKSKEKNQILLRFFSFLEENFNDNPLYLKIPLG